jgi:hypothetical protein
MLSYNRRLPSGHFTCYLNRTYHVLTTTRPGPLCDFYVALLEKGMRPTMARLTWARKIAAITLTIWKKGANFDAQQLHRQAA